MLLLGVGCSSESSNASKNPVASGPFPEIGPLSSESTMVLLGPAAGGLSGTLPQVMTTVMENGPDMLNYGHLNFNVPADSFLAQFEYGDIVTVELDGHEAIDAPVVEAYDDVSSGEYLLRAVRGKPYLTFAINYGQVGMDLGSSSIRLHVTRPSGGGVTPYILNEDIQFPINVRVVMKEKGGYLDALKMRDVKKLGTSIENYPNLTVEEYANFRMITTTGMGVGRLYRSSSPLDASLGRCYYVDSLARAAHVAVFLNLADTELGAKEYPGFSQSYYSAQNVIYLGLPAAFSSSEFKEGLVRGLRYMMLREGPYLVHCREGKDRAGFTIAVLEALMGASLNEIMADYVKTYTNYYSVQNGLQVPLTPEQIEFFEKIIVQNIVLAYANEGVILGTSGNFTLKQATAQYLQKLGLTKDEIALLRESLGAVE